MAEDFFIEKKIYYHDTDCGGVVYYANYLKYLEEARTEYFISKGIGLKKLVAETEGALFIVGEVSIKYFMPARYQDVIKITAAIKSIRPASMIFLQKIYKGNDFLAEAEVKLVCVDSNFKPKVFDTAIKGVLIKEKEG